MSCFTSAKYDCTAVILKPGGSPDTTESGHWEEIEDPITGSIERIWIQDVDPSTPGIQKITIDCVARGFIDTGIRILGTEQDIGMLYKKTDLIKIQFPAAVHLTDKDRITEVRSKRTGALIWREEEMEQLADGAWIEVPTTFSVKGVTPIISPLIGHTENFAILERSEVQ